MTTNPLITFKAGKCTFAGKRVTPDPTPGYLYLYVEDEIPHFCWRPRSAPSSEPEIDLFMVPGDGNFTPWLREEGAEELHSPTNGRVYALKFDSSSQKHFFYLQSKTQHRGGALSWFSDRDQRLGQVVNAILQGEEVDVEGEVRELREGGGGTGGDDAMDLDDGLERERTNSTGGAGADATGGDPREEGEASRGGGADGGRAPTDSQPQDQDPSSVVQNFLRSLQNPASPSSNPTNNPASSQAAHQTAADKTYTTLPDLLPPTQTVPYISTLPPAALDALCAYLPPDLFLLEQELSTTNQSTNPTPAAAQGAIEALAPAQKREILTRVLRSPQLSQSLGSLTVALRDGGLPMIGEALGLKVVNGGNIRGSAMPLGGGEAVEAFVEGVKRTVEEKK